MINSFLRDALQAARDTRWLEISEHALDQVPRVFREQFGDQPAMIVADQNTFASAGQDVAESLKVEGIRAAHPFIFQEPDLYAEHRHVEALEACLREHSVIPIAVGSGTINDLVKLAAHRSSRAYLCVATAASMDGYTAFGASITFRGAKQTFWCPAPQAVIADLGVLCAAPAEMRAWGYADLLAKVTSGADWLVADALGVEPLDVTAWAIVQGRLREMVEEPADVRAGQPEAVARLVGGLMLGGFAMQSAKSSRPASGAEHQFSHLWDMQHHTHRGKTPSHGFKVGIGTLAIAALYEELLRQPLEQLDVDRCCAAWPDLAAATQQACTLVSDPEVTEVAVQEITAKHCHQDELRSQLQRLKETWPKLRLRLEQQLLPVTILREKLAAVGAPTEPEEIGIGKKRLRASYWQAYCIRRRYTVLDLAVRTGMLDSCLDRIFNPPGGKPASAFESNQAERRS